MTAAPATVAVLGSCVTRDNFNSRFNPGYKKAFEAVLMQNQSSIISIMSRGFSLPDDQLGSPSDYDRWNVVTDLSKQFLDELAELKPDYLILDFFGDVHFGVLEVADGQYVTNNRWKLWPTPYYQALKQAGSLRELSIERDTEAYVRLWRESFDRLTAFLSENVPDTRVVVHHGRNASRLRLPDSDKTVALRKAVKLRKLDIARLNALWAELDDYATSSTGYPSIDLTARDHPTYAGHPWGPYYVHYEPDYYHDFLAAFSELHLRGLLTSSHDAQAGVLLDVVLDRGVTREGLSQERHDRVVKRLREKASQQRAQIAALEAQVGRHLRTRLGRGLRLLRRGAQSRWTSSVSVTPRVSKNRVEDADSAGTS